MKISCQWAPLALMFFAFTSHAEEVFDRCGISMLKSKSVNIRVIQGQSEECNAKIEFLVKDSPPIMGDEGNLKVSENSIENVLSGSEYFKKINGHYELMVSHEIQEPQYQLMTLRTRVKVIENRKIRGLLGLEEVRVGANPSWLWPSASVRRRASEKFISEKGLIFDCFYGHLGAMENPITMTISGCIPRSKKSSDLSIREIQKILENIHFEK